MHRRRTDYFTFADVRAALNEYVARNNMADPANPRYAQSAPCAHSEAGPSLNDLHEARCTSNAVGRMVVLNPFLAEHLVPKNDRANVFTAPRDGLATVYVSSTRTHALWVGCLPAP